MVQDKTLEAGLSARSEAFVMRFETRIKYLAELAARRQRRSLTNFVEQAIYEAISKVELRPKTSREPEILADDRSNLLWDIDEVERLRKLEQACPDLVSYEEQRILALISHFGTGAGDKIRFKENEKINWARVKTFWPEIEKCASGKMDEDRFAAAVRAKWK